MHVPLTFLFCCFGFAEAVLQKRIMILLPIDHAVAGKEGAAEPEQADDDDKRPKNKPNDKKGQYGSNEGHDSNDGLCLECLLCMICNEGIFLVIDKVNNERNEYVTHAKEKITAM